jgi:uncharacterized repeat protein (TIGR01451 family)/uncharacterized protein (TIGR03382 family)
VDGNYTVTAANEVLNRYVTLRTDVAAGATSFVVNDLATLDSPIAQLGPLAVGDLLMIIQMQGATIDGTDTPNFGAVTALGSAGLYELVTVASITPSGGGRGTIGINTTSCSGLRNSYTVAGKTQVVRVPQFASLTVNASASVGATPWDGSIGGIIALQVQNALTLSGNLNANAVGFRGGVVEQNTDLGITIYRATTDTSGGAKGEGIAGYEADYDAFGGRYGRGAPANGGGGGNAHNAGGGGGANGNAGGTWTGQGVMTGTFPGQDPWRLDPAFAANGNARTSSPGGGRGGYTYSANNQDAVTVGPGNTSWGGDNRAPVGGFGGRPVPNDPGTRLFLGGGGGAGDSNNGTGGTGGRGGGLVWVVADAVSGTGRITANGQNGVDTTGAGNDAPGGGGAGGTVVVAARALSGVIIDANGGRGGIQNIATNEAEGPGGGGGGGFIAVSGGTVTRNVAGGVNGTSNSPAVTEFTQNGATAGAAGQLGAAVAALPLCMPADLTITKTNGTTSSTPGSTVTYTITVTNNGPNAVGGATVTDLLPAALTGASWTCAPAAACGTASGTGNISAAPVTLGSGGTATFTVTATVAPSATGTLTNTATVAVPVGYTDPATGNNSATDTDTLTPRADLAVALTDSPDPVNGNATLTYTVSVNNLGPSTAASVTARLNLPAGAPFVSATGTGWTCSQAGGVVTCDRPSAAPGATPAITVQVTAPNANTTLTATASVSTTTTDPVAGNNSASQSTTVNRTNNPPTANDDTLMVAEDSGATMVDVLANDSFEPDADETLTVTAVTQPATGGTVTLDAGVVRFTPAPDFFGTTSFTYTIDDGNGGTDTATVTVTVTPVNDPPVANDDTLMVDEDSGATVVNVLGNDTSAPESETLTVTAVTQPATGGTVTLEAGVVRFTPASDFFGTVTFTYTVSDGNGGTDTATVTITVRPVNDPPVANDDTLMVDEDSGATVVDVLGNDTSTPENETLTVTAVTQPATGGTVALDAGVVRFTPAPDFFGTTSFMYTISDGNGGTDTATVMVTVRPVNDPPAANDDTLTVDEDSAATVVDVLGNDTSAPESETLTVTAVTQPATGGTVTLTDGEVRFTPAPDFTGTVTFTYTISDGNGGTDTATVTVTVRPVNDPPIANDDAFIVIEDSTGNVLDVLINDTSAPENETLTVTAVTQPATGGTVTLTDGEIRFTPAPDFTGTVTFTYTIDDGNGGTDTATVTVTVQGANNLPVANNDTLTVDEDSGATVVDVLGNDTSVPDVEETLTVTAVTQPATGGTVTLDAGVVRFTPAPDFFGTTSFTYTISDETGDTDTATVTVTVTPVNDPPAANDDTLTVDEDSGATVVNVLGNDTSAPESETLTVTAVTQPVTGGTVTLDAGVVRFTPAPDFFGTVTFTYTISDGNGGTDTATVTVTVRPVNDPPVANDDTLVVAEDSGATVVNVLGNDTSAPENETLTVTAVTQPATGGTVTLDAGEVRFTPAPDFNGTVTFTYTISDGNGGTDTATVTVTVTPVDEVLSAVDDAFTVAEDSADNVLNVLANDSGGTGTLTVTAVTQPATGGTVTLNAGVVTFTPTPNFFGTVTFTYTVSDDAGGTDTATVTVTVENVNDPPTGRPDTYTVPGNSGATTLPVLDNDSSAPDRDETLTVDSVTQPATGGTVSVAPGGTGVVFTPAPGFSGQVTFTYTVSDGNGGTATVIVIVNVGTVDSDGDGLSDEREAELGTDPNNPDTDDDGLADGLESTTGTNPLDDDTDDDGLIDGSEDANHNGMVDPDETNPRQIDTDGDGLSDGLEQGLTEPEGEDTDPARFTPDTDPSTTTDPLNPDTDGDTLMDGTEDADHDGRLDDAESDPNDPDSDDGGLNDGEEVNQGGNPRSYTDDLIVAGRGCASTGTGTLLPLLLLLAVPLLRRRQTLRASVKVWGTLGLLAAVLVSAPASAQSAPAASQGIDVQQYKPAPGWRDVLGMHSPQVARHLGWNLGLSFNYAKDPLNFLRPRTDDFIYEIVKNQMTFDLMGAIALFDRFELGVALPITSQSSASAASVSPLLSEGVDATGIGDLRLVPKAHLLSTEGGLRLGVAVPLLLPTSGGKEFLGRSGLAVFPRLLGEWSSDGGTRVLANVGVNLQPSAQFYNLNVGNEFAYGVGAEVPFQLGKHRLAAEATLMGAIGMKETQTEERPLEVLAALRYRITDTLGAHLGGGPGLTRGYGTPGFRVLAGIIWTEAERAVPARIEPPPPPAKVCPQGPEDVDGFQDEDGCADPDNDGDGLMDGKDRCPNQPETKNGFEDEDGCADELPPPPPVDSDGDGLTDDKDRCPQAAEDKDGFQDEDGCPDPDNDRDGVVDASDKCPAEPETINGVQDEDGCPDKGKEKVKLEGEKIVILDKVYFATRKDVILAKSFPLLKQVGQVLRANPQLTKVRVEGHTDSQGSDAFNLDLSQRRANSVRKRLIEQEGIAPERLEAVGYGETRPVDTNKTAKGRENNRRVEFIILEVKEQP